MVKNKNSQTIVSLLQKKKSRTALTLRKVLYNGKNHGLPELTTSPEELVIFSKRLIILPVASNCRQQPSNAPVIKTGKEWHLVFYLESM